MRLIGRIFFYLLVIAISANYVFSDNIKLQSEYKSSLDKYYKNVADSSFDTLSSLVPLIKSVEDLIILNDSIKRYSEAEINNLKLKIDKIEKSNLAEKEKQDLYKYIAIAIIAGLLLIIALIVILSALKSKKLKKHNTELKTLNDQKREENLKLRLDVELFTKERKALENEIAVLNQNSKLIEEKFSSEILLIKSEKENLIKENNEMILKISELNNKIEELNEKIQVATKARDRVEKELEGFVKELRGILPLPE